MNKLSKPSNVKFYILLSAFVCLIVLTLYMGKTYYLDQNDSLEALSPSLQQNPEQLVTGPVCKLDIVLMMDVSQSMRNYVDGRRKIEWARDGLNAFVDRIETIASQPGYNLDLGLVQIGSRGLSDHSLEVPLTHDYASLHPAINNLNWIGPDGGTCLLCGLNLATNHLIDRSGVNTKKIAILMSDGCGNRDYSDWIGIPVSRNLTTAEANYGRDSHDIYYYTLGYNTEGLTGDPCGPDQYDEATLLGIAGDPSRHYFRPDPNDWIPTFETIADSLCSDTTVNSCAINSSVTSTQTSPYTIAPGSTLNVGTNFSSVDPLGKSVEVRYSLSNTGVVSISPSSTFTIPMPAGSTSLSYYYTNVNLEPLAAVPSGATTELKADVYMDGTLQCSTTTYLEVGSAPSWWQVFGGDAIAGRGNISSAIPTASNKTLFSTAYLGLPIYDGNINPSNRNYIGTPGWNVDSRFRANLSPAGTNYNYNYFANKFTPTFAISQSSISGASFFDTNVGTVKNGYQVYVRNGDLNINTLNFVNSSSKKVIIFVTGNTYIDGKITLDDGKDFFMIISKGNILINNSVGDTSYTSVPPAGSEDLEGVFVADGEVKTGYNGPSSRQLVVRGITIGWGNGGSINGVSFQRNLGSSNIIYPAEIFKFAPDMLLNFPPFYAEKTISWKEVRP